MQVLGRRSPNPLPFFMEPVRGLRDIDFRIGFKASIKVRRYIWDSVLGPRDLEI